jgi:hypothetical protein
MSFYDRKTLFYGMQKQTKQKEYNLYQITSCDMRQEEDSCWSVERLQGVSAKKKEILGKRG